MENDLDTDGFCWLRSAFDRSEINVLQKQMDALKTETSKAGQRLSQTEFDGIRLINGSQICHDTLSNSLGNDFVLLRVILFDKSSDSPWLVKWHRDTMIPVKEHKESDMLKSHSMKDDVPHVRATVEILTHMLSLRIHLDDADASNGALRVIRGSHCVEHLSTAHRAEDYDENEIETCTAKAGDVLCIRPLLLHASSKPVSGMRRRILHMEFTAKQSLPDGFE
ncbi:MAG: phytanoyl-CoA dioxygenase family protein, partial [Lentisphaeria bacterium]|nr:phytanoyl-CoA dioxygenase family protein [Lentisphaeria bacterium]NQZ69205.1 phytanoyl-CoA dioxygenase family protein [Lentisphaeria bacterium]